jgi:hypothetical protein
MPRLKRLLQRIEETEALDRPAAVLTELLPPAFRRHPVTDLLRGSWLGHPLHPAVVLAPIGMYLSSTVLDLVPGEGRTARALIGLGLVTTPAAVATGLAEWTTLDVRQRRTAVAHLSANLLGSACYLASFRMRGRGHGLFGRLASVLGLGLVGTGGMLGGHLSYAQGAGVNREPV